MERVRGNYKGKISTLTIGGNEREKTVCGGHMSLPFMVTPYQKPLLALEVYDFIALDYNHFLKDLWAEENFLLRVKQAARYSPDALCLRFISSDPDLGITLKEEPQALLKKVTTETTLPLIITGCGVHTVDEELIPLLSKDSARFTEIFILAISSFRKVVIFYFLTEAEGPGEMQQMM